MNVSLNVELRLIYRKHYDFVKEGSSKKDVSFRKTTYFRISIIFELELEY